jgi:hypothetical protein
MLSIFTPSRTESIGLTWLGQGGDGGPVPMLPEDITGVFPQAYWNNLAGRTNTLTHPTNSSNQAHPTITVQWATSGEWLTSLGDEYPAERLLDGLCTSYGTNENTAQTVTLSGVPPGYHSVLLYAMQRAAESNQMDFQVLTFHSDGTQKAMAQRFIRPQNSDEYYKKPGFILVNSETPATRAVGNTLWINNLKPEDGRIQVRFFSPGRAETNAFGDPARGPGLNGLQLLLNPPVMTTVITSSNELLISWPAAVADFMLETTDKLNPPDWRLVVPIPIVSGDRYELRLPASKPQEYFRLRR